MPLPFPADFGKTPDDVTAMETGLEVTLVERSREFLLELAICDAGTIERVGAPPARSPLYDAGNCISFAIFRPVGGRDIRDPYGEVARIRVISGDQVRPYIDCMSCIGGFSLPLVSVGDSEVGGGILYARAVIRTSRTVYLCI